MIGQTISHYKIMEKLGEGGMGVVYKAQDTKLDRAVALKFLPAHLSASEQDKARFIQEAKAAATLNHPNICTIHSIEEYEGQLFIAMQFVDGQLLRDRMSGPSVKQAIEFGIQIADGLGAAHEKGIVHRDIKPENIMVRKDGIAQIMDFGLAKLLGVSRLTKEGSTVGTAGYMSPEQVQGQDADHRSDIFSLGVVLYELFTGQLPFKGVHEAALMYEIVNVEAAPMSSIRPDVDAELDRIVLQCLEKEPSERTQSVKQVSVDLNRFKRESGKRRVSKTFTAGAIDVSKVSPDRTMEKSSSSRARTWLPWVLAVAFFLSTLSVTVWRGWDNPTTPKISFLQLTDQPGAELFPDISPDGSFLVYTHPMNDQMDIFLQRPGGGNPINLTVNSTDDDYQPSFSPDGSLIAFRSERNGGGIFIMGATGESVRRITTAGFNPAWSPDGKKILFATESVEHPFSRGSTSELWTADIADGKTTRIYKGDAVQPSWSPHGYRITFWGLPKGTGFRELWTIPAEGGDAVRLTNDQHIDWSPIWSPDGEYVYFLSDRGGSMNLWRVPIDERVGKLRGEFQTLTLPSRDCSSFRPSRDGRRIVYTSLDIRANIYKVGFDTVKETLTGSPIPITRGSRVFDYPHVSLDGKWIACASGGVQEDLFIMRNDGSELRRVTNDSYKDRGPQWSPDGKSLVFYSERGGKWDIWRINSDGSQPEQLTEKTVGTQVIPRWFPDGKRLTVQGDTMSYMLDLAQPIKHRVGVPFPPIGGGDEVFEPTSITHDAKLIAGQINTESSARVGIMVYSINEKTYTKVTNYGEGPQWLSDSRRLLFLHRGKFHLVNWTTKRTKELSSSPSGARTFVSFSLSPDNRFIYYSNQEKESDIWQAVLE